MKLPNNYGSVFKLAGKRRRPWAARLPARKKDGKMIYLGYYATQQEALSALAEHNKNPFDADAANITFAQMFEAVKQEHFPKISKSQQAKYNSAYNALAPLHAQRIRTLKRYDLQNAIDESGKNYPTLVVMKDLISVVYSFAMRDDICARNYASLIDIAKYKDQNPNARPHTVFAPEEIAALWAHSADRCAQLSLMLIYSGLRIGEFCAMEEDCIHTTERWLDVRQAKTAAGVRQVPIAAKTLDFWSGERAKSERTLRDALKAYWRSLGMEHDPHDCRHTCVSLLTEAQVDERLIKWIVGHARTGVTEQVYTHIGLPALIEAIDRI